ncbi:sugar transferase [Massilia sp. R2A-15]|uniref:sugar transferase n=1 Tax=Massilia sp. R2A-15 TaxID=3064278 RepID=UPI002736E849|nr:sugar transferase [Massilia sp. R2A-15]WLI90667.1 sugar transferase [Massilia sp. R2A-15]
MSMPDLAMSKTDIFLKRAFDLCFSAAGIIVFAPLILACWIIAAIETRGNGFFVHPRVGRHGQIFRVIKIKTMHAGDARRSPIAAHNAAVITRSGAFFRKYKLDELPQLFNVFMGSMSFVGPRPDVPSYADQLTGNDRIILLMRPGITGPASIKYRNEEYLLSIAEDPRLYNDSVIWPDKVRINKEYFLNYSLLGDFKYIAQTLFR